jgi:hypothetical protein
MMVQEVSELRYKNAGYGVRIKPLHESLIRVRPDVHHVELPLAVHDVRRQDNQAGHKRDAALVHERTKLQRTSFTSQPSARQHCSKRH